MTFLLPYNIVNPRNPARDRRPYAAAAHRDHILPWLTQIMLTGDSNFVVLDGAVYRHFEMRDADDAALFEILCRAEIGLPRRYSEWPDPGFEREALARCDSEDPREMPWWRAETENNRRIFAKLDAMLALHERDRLEAAGVIFH